MLSEVTCGPAMMMHGLLGESLMRILNFEIAEVGAGVEVVGTGGCGSSSRQIDDSQYRIPQCDRPEDSQRLVIVQVVGFGHDQVEWNDVTGVA